MKNSYPDYWNNKSKQTRNRDTLEDVFTALSKENQTIINEYISYCRKDAGENTLRKYWNKIVQIADVMEKPLDKLTLKDVLGFLAILNTSNRGTDSRNDTKKVLKRFLKWKYKGKKEFLDIDREIKQKKKGSSERLSKKDLLTPEEMELLVRNADSLRWKALIMLMYETGCRPEECYKLKWKDLDFNTKQVSINSSKTKEARVIPLENSIIHLKRYYNEYSFPDVTENDFIFPSTNREKHINPETISAFLKQLSKRINKKVFPYLFRHTRLQEIRPKLSVEAYQKLAGHSIETALKHYGHLDQEDAGKEMREFIYKVQELTPQEKNEIKKLKEQMKELYLLVGDLSKVVLGQKQAKDNWRKISDQMEERYLKVKNK